MSLESGILFLFQVTPAETAMFHQMAKQRLILQHRVFRDVKKYQYSIFQWSFLKDITGWLTNGSTTIFLKVKYVAPANISKQQLPKTCGLVQMVCWKQNKPSKSESKKYKFWGRNRNQVDYLKVVCPIWVFLIAYYLFCLEASLPRSQNLLGFFEQFYATE